VRIERAKLPLAALVAAACTMLDVDPYWALSEGTLIACAGADRASVVVQELAGDKIPSAIVGEVLPGKGKLWVAEPDGAVSTFESPRPDPWWAAYDRAVREGWR
jgi:hydrogenase maturation factor